MLFVESIKVLNVIFVKLKMEPRETRQKRNMRDYLQNADPLGEKTNGIFFLLLTQNLALTFTLNLNLHSSNFY